MNQPVVEGIFTDAKKRYGAGAQEYKQMGHWQPDHVTKDRDVVGMFRIAPQKGVDAGALGKPMFDLKDACRKTYLNHSVRVTKSEPGFGLVRQEVEGRQIRSTIHNYATD